MSENAKPAGAGGLHEDEARCDSEINHIENPAECQALLSIITSTRPEFLSKKLYLDDQGQLQKKAAAEMVEGTAEQVTVSGLTDFSTVLQRLKKNQALAYGITAHAMIALITKKAWLQAGRPDDRIPRTKDFFTFPPGQPGVFMFDYDPEATGDTCDRDELVEFLRMTIPGIKDAALLWYPSSSSHIHNNEKEIIGLKGQRLYCLVRDSSDIPRAAAAIQEYLWTAGYGYFKVGVAGQLMERNLIDATVYQPNRLDFAAGAICKPPLEQRRGDPVLIPGDIEFLDTADAIPDPGPDVVALAKAYREKARATVKESAKGQRELYINTKAAEIAGEGATDEAMRQAKATVRRAVEQSTLHGDFPVFIKDGGKARKASVGNILDNPALYHSLQTLDPLEPEYDGGRAVGKLYLYGSQPNLFSFARGGRVFKLMRQPARIQLVRGQTYRTTLQTLDLLREQPDLFNLGSSLVIVEAGRSYPLDEHALKHEIAGRMQYHVAKKDKEGNLVEILEDPPAKVAKSIIALGERRRLKKLAAAVDMPLIRPDGSLLNKPGYDEKTQILLDILDPAEIPQEPTITQCAEALSRLMIPFSEFPICSETDEAVFLAAVFTAVSRPALDMAPAFGIDAPVQGTGKTLLARCLSILSTGEAPSVWPHTAHRDDEEVRKRLFSALREGSRAILWDNVLGILSSASLAAALTSPEYQDRILGKSESQQVPNKALFLITGNNICLAGDLPRRIFLMRMDPGMEKPFSRRFAMDPAAYCQENRREMIIDALTIMRGAFVHYEAPADDVGFTQWNELVRRAVLFAGGKLAPERFGDPKTAIDDAQQTDPEQEELYALLSSWWDCFGSRKVTAREVIESRHGDLTDAVADVMGDKPATSKGLGRILRFKKDRITGGMVLKEAPGIKKMAKNWYVTEVSPG